MSHQWGYILRQSQLIGGIILDVEREKPKRHLEQVLEHVMKHLVCLLLDHEERVLDEEHPQLVNLEMTHDVLPNGVDVLGL
jgi:hypothetical protein